MIAVLFDSKYIYVLSILRYYHMLMENREWPRPKDGALFS